MTLIGGSRRPSARCSDERDTDTTYGSHWLMEGNSLKSMAGAGGIPFPRTRRSDGPRRLQCDLFKLFLGHLDELILVEHVTLNDVLVGHLIPGVRIDLEVPNACPVFRLSWLNEIFSPSDVAG